ncbi:glycosyltransferase family 4 protein [Mesobacillus jeotgali]|uniref:glycosyltransferase family 4 protein n=1 Tax=Mesobacillus jeotgali TaxID=129985 RepID=UPI000C835AF4|nr:glycosyltransferase family 4 protein [Mesobacillus jeotgali]
MKIIYLSWFSSGEGSQVHASEFIEAMEQLGHEVIPVELSLRKQNQASNIQRTKELQQKSNKLKLILREARSVAMNIPRVLRLTKLIKEHKPDCVINRYSPYDLSAIIAGKLMNVPVIYEVNASVVFERDLEKRFYIKGLLNWFEKKVFKSSDAVTVVSNELKRYFAENSYDVSKTIVVPNGVDIDKFSLDAPAPDFLVPLKEKWENDVVIGFLGSLKSWHGVERGIDILPDLLKHIPNLRFLIIGDGNERERLENKINELSLTEYVKITGFLDHKEIPGALNLMDIAIAPYKDIEFFHFSPLKIFEYMAMGKPVVAPALGQCKELIETGYNGILLEENTNDHLAEAIKKIADNDELRGQMAFNARDFIEKHYTWKANAKKYETAILEIKSEKRK